MRCTLRPSRAFARGVGYTDPVYYDEAEAKKRGYRSLPAPATYFGTAVFIPGKSNDTFSGPNNEGPSLKHGLRNVLDGGAETEYFDDICAGDTLTVSIQIADLSVRESKTTGQMLIVTRETTCKNQHGKVVAKLDGASDTTFTVPIDRPTWLLARAYSNRPWLPVLDLYPFASTSPVYVTMGNAPVSCGADAEFFLAWINGLSQRVRADANWNTSAERDSALALISRAHDEFIRRR